MTRSEKLEVATINARGRMFAMNHDSLASDAQKEVARFNYDLLLAEQKRSEGCHKCNGVLSVDDALYFEDGKAGMVEYFAKFCPNCGRDLTEGESV